MRDLKDRFIIWMWNHLPEKSIIKNNEGFTSLVGESAQRQIEKTKQDIIKSRWQKVNLENKLENLKNNV